MKRILIIICLILITSGCATIRELGEAERGMLQDLNSRLTANEKLIQTASTTLGEIGGDYAEWEYDLDIRLAKAKRLEAMTSLWVKTDDELKETRRAVLFYHLYEVELAEQKVIEARVKERQEAAKEIITAYRRLNALTKDAQKNLEIVLKYVNQPRSAQILEVTTNFLNEVKAFREELQSSDNPRLRKLAENVQKFEDKSFKAKEQAVKVFETYEKIK